MVTIAQEKGILVKDLMPINHLLPYLGFIYYNSCQYICLIIIYRLSIVACKLSAYVCLSKPSVPSLYLYHNDHKWAKFAFY